MSSTFRNVLRWVGVLPLAALLYFLAYVFLRLILGLNQWFFGGDKGFFLTYVMPGIAAGYGAYCFVAVAAMLAPSHRKYTALGLLILLAMTVGVTVLAMTREFHGQTMMETLGHIIGGIAGYVNTEELEKEEEARAY